MLKKIITYIVSFMALFSLSVTPIFAHAVVKPNSAGVGAFTDFTLGVPSEKPITTTAVKLMMPAGLNYVSPIVKPGWKIDLKQTPDPSGKKDDDGNPAMVVSEISWTGGQVPASQKDLFMFSAQVPAQATELQWKVMQTYADGSVVSWSLGSNEPQPKDSAGKSDFSKFGPYSKTMVVNDLKPTSPPVVTQVVNAAQSKSSDSLPLVLSGLAVVLSLVALVMPMMRKKQTSV